MRKSQLAALIFVGAGALGAVGACMSQGSRQEMQAPPQWVSGPVAKPIDLGLSVKWASHNLGASTPEGYGGQYGWGDPTGMKTSTSNADYPGAAPPAEISGAELDIARVQWGAPWRLPTKAEQEELLSKATWAETDLNGVRGYRVTGPNGNSIFLPASGGRIGDRIHYRIVGGDYWSGTLSSSVGKAYCMYFYQGRQRTDDLPRHYGFAVRAVAN